MRIFDVIDGAQRARSAQSDAIELQTAARCVVYDVMCKKLQILEKRIEQSVCEGVKVVIWRHEDECGVPRSS